MNLFNQLRSLLKIFSSNNDTMFIPLLEYNLYLIVSSSSPSDISYNQEPEAHYHEHMFPTK